MIFALLLSLLSAPVLACVGYLFVLSLFSRVPPRPRYVEPRMRFDLIVPAHDEEHGITETVQSLLAIDYPSELRRVVVVADNCTDATAARASAAGAIVIVRDDVQKRGKGYALKRAFERSREDAFADAVVVVDADTLASKNLLHAFAARFERGAQAVQAEYGVGNPGASWRTRLMVIALAMFHTLRSLGRERLGLSSGLRGNGMGFTRGILATVPHDAFSIVEDVEYGIRLGLHGHRVWYVAEARVLGEMVASGRASQSQRDRWESGRVQLARRFGASLFTQALRQRDPLLLDLGLDLLVPPLSYVAVLAVSGTLAACAIALLGGDVMVVLPWAACLVMLGAYVGRGVVLAGVGARGLVDLLFAPLYVTWKIALSFRRTRRGKEEWVRTARHGDASP